ncbi:MAG TPA: hypothetical protein V6C52_06740 [Coleofasciculaceae cyanobacterium]
MIATQTSYRPFPALKMGSKKPKSLECASNAETLLPTPQLSFGQKDSKAPKWIGLFLGVLGTIGTLGGVAYLHREKQYQAIYQEYQELLKLNHQATLGLNSIVNTQEKSLGQINQGLCNINSILDSYPRTLAPQEAPQADSTLEESCKFL